MGEIWASAGAAREPWLAGVEVRDRRERGDRAPLRLGRAPGHLRGGRRYPLRLAPSELLAAESPLLVALDQVQDPQNLGAICRTAECAGAAGVVIPERRAAEVTPAVCKASAGAVEHLRVARVRNLADFLAEARRAGCWSYGASAQARRRAPPVPYDEPDYAGRASCSCSAARAPACVPAWPPGCDELIALPLLGRVGSLDVSAAAAALLYEILQNRRRGLDRAS